MIISNVFDPISNNTNVNRININDQNFQHITHELYLLNIPHFFISIPVLS